MAAEVSSLVRVLNGYYCNDDQVVMNETGKSTALITQDLLGGSSMSSKLDDSQELDLDLQVSNGWEKRLDLKPGKVYIQRCHSPNYQTNQTVAKIQDIHFLPPSSSSSSSSKLLLNLFDETSLDLKLVPSSLLTSSSSPCNYQSVCTLDKVKFALERAERNLTKKRPSLSHSSSPSNSSSSSIKVTQEKREYDCEKKTSVSPSGLLFAAGCPSCLLYVIISKNNPRCPRCNSNVSLPMMKKPRIDLNISI